MSKSNPTGKKSAGATGKLGHLPNEQDQPLPPLASAKPEAKSMEVLYGSSILPSMVEIGGKEVQLGSIVAGAFDASGMTVEAWNAQPEEEREILLAKHIEALQAQEQEQAKPDAIEAPVLHRITRIEQAQALAEINSDSDFTEATDAHTDIHAFKSVDGRTLRVVLAGGSLNSVEIRHE